MHEVAKDAKRRSNFLIFDDCEGKGLAIFIQVAKFWFFAHKQKLSGISWSTDL